MTEDIVYHNGVAMHIKQLIELAKNADEYSLAQPYIISLLYYANIYQLQDVTDEVDKIRKHYNLLPFPTVNAPASKNNMPYYDSPQMKQAEIVRKFYLNLKREQREDILKEALDNLRLEKKELFNKNACWIGIYLVVRDRLDDDLKMKSFCEYNITPSDWPSKFALGNSSLSNIGRYINSKDKSEPYYFMEDNPFSTLCDKFWEILFCLIFDEKTDVN